MTDATVELVLSPLPVPGGRNDDGKIPRDKVAQTQGKGPLKIAVEKSLDTHETHEFTIRSLYQVVGVFQHLPVLYISWQFEENLSTFMTHVSLSEQRSRERDVSCS